MKASRAYHGTFSAGDTLPVFPLDRTLLTFNNAENLNLFTLAHKSPEVEIEKAYPQDTEGTYPTAKNRKFKFLDIEKHV